MNQKASTGAPSMEETEVPGPPIRGCAVGSNNLVPRGSKLSAIDVIAKAILERLYLVSGLRQFVP